MALAYTIGLATDGTLSGLFSMGVERIRPGQSTDPAGSEASYYDPAPFADYTG